MRKHLKTRFVLAKLNAGAAVVTRERLGIWLAVMNMRRCRAEMSWINRDRSAGSFDLGCALARAGSRVVTVRRDLGRARQGLEEEQASPVSAPTEVETTVTAFNLVLM
ncbi:hypothetical protein Q0M94_17885 (plasmid) [Deinococcus radiomollis]|uniref:hypothetical protein n=1 Tax=Deinococcus radiomollis TaxID=468916 RepID=UPI003891476F